MSRAHCIFFFVRILARVFMLNYFAQPVFLFSSLPHFGLQHERNAISYNEFQQDTFGADICVDSNYFLSSRSMCASRYEVCYFGEVWMARSFRNDINGKRSKVWWNFEAFWQLTCRLFPSARQLQLQLNVQMGLVNWSTHWQTGK